MSFMLTLFAPIFGGLFYGIERKIRARMQKRKGPPILQPFYDMFKLIDKRTIIVHPFHAILAVVYFLILWIVIGFIFFKLNLLYIIFLHLLAFSVLVIAGYSVKSPYSHIGANRKLLSLLAYEPILLLSAVGFYIVNNSFEIKDILSHQHYLGSLSLIFISLLFIIPIKLNKSPFDIVEAHQEIVGGVEIEYSGFFYEFLYMARFLEYIFIYFFIFLFGGSNTILGIILVIFSFLLINIIDNSTTRVKVDNMLSIIYKIALVLSIVNIWWLL